MSAQDWSRNRKPSKSFGGTSANSVPIGVIVQFYGGEVKEGRNVSVRCCVHNDTRKSAVIDTINNLYYCHTCGVAGNGVNIITHKEGLEFKDALKRANEIVAGSGGAIRSGNNSANSRVSRRTWNL
jgi:DNA primase